MTSCAGRNYTGPADAPGLVRRCYPQRLAGVLAVQRRVAWLVVCQGRAAVAQASRLLSKSCVGASLGLCAPRSCRVSSWPSPRLMQRLYRRQPPPPLRPSQLRRIPFRFSFGPRSSTTSLPARSSLHDASQQHVLHGQCVGWRGTEVWWRAVGQVGYEVEEGGLVTMRRRRRRRRPRARAFFL